MTITDTHTFYSEEFDQDRDEMIQRALIKVFPVFLFLQSTLPTLRQCMI
jgi:hypothetical protein